MSKPDVFIDGEASETDNEDIVDEHEKLRAAVESVSNALSFD